MSSSNPNQNGSTNHTVSQLQSAASPPYTRSPPDQYQNTNNNWNETLNSNKAGAASNAEDFTKQFMSDMFGGAGMSQSPVVSNTPIQKSEPAPPPIPSMLQQKMDQKLAQ